MKKIIWLSLFVCLLIACSEETTETNSKDSTTEPITTSEVGSETSESTEEDDRVTSNPLEVTATLILDSLEEMSDWNSIEMYTSYKETYVEGSESAFEFLRLTQYLRDTSEVYIDEQYMQGYYDRIQYYSSGSGVSYIDTGDGFSETDNEQITRDHIQSRIDFLTFAYKNGENRSSELDGNEAVETFTISPNVYEEFSDLLHPILSIFVDDLDNNYRYEEVKIQILVEGLQIKGYTISMKYQLQELDSLEEATLMESFESIDELKQVESPIAG